MNMHDLSLLYMIGLIKGVQQIYACAYGMVLFQIYMRNTREEVMGLVGFLAKNFVKV